MSEGPSRLPFLWWVIAFIVAAALIVGVYTKSGGRRAALSSPLEQYGAAPEFQLTTQDGTTLSKKDLLGKIWVANFIFTRCQGPCPMMSSRMSEVGRLTADMPELKLVSVSVDPAYDTPPVLKEYAERLGAKPEKWKFLTGDPDTVSAIIQKGFFQPLGKETDGMPMHSTRFILIDRNGEMRAFQDGSDPQVAEKLLANIQTLLAEQPAR